MIRFKWFSGDTNFLQYGGRWISNEQTSGEEGERFFFGIELINWEDAQGSLGPGKTKYNLSLVIVPHPSEVRYEQMLKAFSCCGQEEEMLALSRRYSPGRVIEEITKNNLQQALDAFWSFGLCIPLWEYNTNNWRDGLRILKLGMEEVDYSFQMEQPVNRIGQTGREYLYGDMISAIGRGLEAGSKEAWIVAKVHGAKEEQLEELGFKSPFRENKYEE